MIDVPKNLPRSVIIQTDHGQILRRNFSHLHKTQADIKSNKVAVPETKYDEPVVQQAPAQAQAQSQIMSESLPASRQSSPSTSSHTVEANLTQPAKTSQSSRFGRVI